METKVSSLPAGAMGKAWQQPHSWGPLLPGAAFGDAKYAFLSTSEQNQNSSKIVVKMEL